MVEEPTPKVALLVRNSANNMIVKHNSNYYF